MATSADSKVRIPLICVDKSAWTCAEIFNPNVSSGASKGIVQSCWTKCSVLHHCVRQVAGLCKEPEQACQQYINSIQQQWRTAPFDPGKVVVFGQIPELHIQIETLFSGLKTLLDLLVQLLSSEGIVSGAVHGFHQDKRIYGGNVLNALERNVSKDRNEIAAKVRPLISEHKMLWIDQAIQARHDLIHPEKGLSQLMFHLDFVEQGNSLVCVKVSPPVIGSEAIDQYAQRVLKHAQEFSSSFLGLLRQEAGLYNDAEAAL